MTEDSTRADRIEAKLRILTRAAEVLGAHTADSLTGQTAAIIAGEAARELEVFSRHSAESADAVAELIEMVRDEVREDPDNAAFWARMLPGFTRRHESILRKADLDHDTGVAP